MTNESLPAEQLLLPCPFCGGEVDPRGWLGGDGVRGPECEECGATAQSMEDWNKRAAVEPRASLQDAWNKYGRHLSSCQRYGRLQCTCGFAETSQELEVKAAPTKLPSQS